MRDRIKIQEVIAVEGKYDKNTLAQIFDASCIVTLDGFAVFKDREKVKFLRRLAQTRGLVVLTDSDGAGFVLRNFIKSCIPNEFLKQAYIPDIEGRERRKKRGGKEGKLGVEGMTPEVLISALRRAGVHFCGTENVGSEIEKSGAEAITMSDFVELGLSGGAESGKRRLELQKKLDLPEKMSTHALLEALNLLYSHAELYKLCGK